MEKLVSTTLADRAFDMLEAAIVSGELGAGERLSEAMLARRFGISRGPLREAIGRLEGKKLVERTTHIGPRVTSLAPEDLLELFYIREALEGMACRLAAEKLSAAGILELEALLAEQAKAADVNAGVGYFQAHGDHDFHFRIAEASGNRKLTNLLCGDLYSLLRLYRYRSSLRVGRAKTALSEHRAIIKALRSRNGDKAEEAMRAHIRNSRTSIEKALREAAADAKELDGAVK